MSIPTFDCRTLNRPTAGLGNLRRCWLKRSTFGLVLWMGSGFVRPLKFPLLGAESRREWPYEVDAGQFRIHADFQLMANDSVLTELDHLSADVAQMLRISLPKTIMHVVLFGGEQEYRRYMAHYFPSLPQRRALFIQTRGTGMLFAHRHADLATDLRHEAVHALLNEGSKPLPLWLDEGLAEYFEVPQRQRWRGHCHLESINGMLAKPGWPDLEHLEAASDVSSMSSDQYRDAWAWVHFLLHRHRDTRDLLVEHLDALRVGRPCPPLSRTIAAQFPNWDSALQDHFKCLSNSG